MHSFSNVYVHIVFATKLRNPVIDEQTKQRVEQYFSGIIKNRRNSLLCQYAMPDHYHGLVRLNPQETVAGLIKTMKASSTKWLNDEFYKGAFCWQIGYGAFSHLAGSLDAVIQYIQNQPAHHATMSLQEEADKINKKYSGSWLLD